MSKRHALRSEAANDQRIRVLVSTGSTVPGHVRVANRHAGRLTRLQVGVAHVKQVQRPFTSRDAAAPAHPSDDRRLSPAHLRRADLERRGSRSGTAPSPATTSPSQLAPRPVRSTGAPRASTSRQTGRDQGVRPTSVPDGERRTRACRSALRGPCSTRSNSASAASPAPAPWYRSTTVRATQPLGRVRVQRAARERRVVTSSICSGAHAGRVRDVHREQRRRGCS